MHLGPSCHCPKHWLLPTSSLMKRQIDGLGDHKQGAPPEAAMEEGLWPQPCGGPAQGAQPREKEQQREPTGTMGNASRLHGNEHCAPPGRTLLPWQASHCSPLKQAHCQENGVDGEEHASRAVGATC
mmetsp:Transcript_1784/g.3767  ORF Transcript_1784/g.3767 Transcript_1784/m.3767 type:complete len:127 (-) Transcript_1784:1087-1467(-)